MSLKHIINNIKQTEIMKAFTLFISSFLFIMFIGACNCGGNSKADTWDEAQKAEWTNNCMKFMETNGVEEKNATDFCDCMLKKTSEKYTPEEAAGITEEEERKLWEGCDYTW